MAARGSAVSPGPQRPYGRRGHVRGYLAGRLAVSATRALTAPHRLGPPQGQGSQRRLPAWPGGGLARSGWARLMPLSTMPISVPVPRLRAHAASDLTWERPHCLEYRGHSCRPDARPAAHQEDEGDDHGSGPMRSAEHPAAPSPAHARSRRRRAGADRSHADPSYVQALSLAGRFLAAGARLAAGCPVPAPSLLGAAAAGPSRSKRGRTLASRCHAKCPVVAISPDPSPERRRRQWAVRENALLVRETALDESSSDPNRRALPR